jgi:pyruvate dehydrogenase kinase 2/3/4
MAKYYQAAHTKQTAVSLQALHVFGKLASGPDAVKTFITAACFLHRELPIRFAHRIVELDHLPHGLAEMSAIRKVSSWYKQSFREIAEHPLPDTPEKEASFARLLEAIYERHGPTLVTMAKGIYQFRRSLGIPHGQPLPYSIEENVQRYLDTFFSSRVGIRTLISHYVTLHRPAPPFIGIINTECCPAQVIRDAVTDARAVCERVYGDAPDVEILGATDFKFSFVPAYLHHIAFELIKNSMRAVVESHNRRAAEEQAARVAALSSGGSGNGSSGSGKGKGEASSDIFESSGTPPGLVSYPPIRAILSASEGCEDVTIKISDEGGGIPRSSMARTFNYFFSTAPPQFSEDDEGDNAQDFTRSVPLAGLGVGLSLSRVMARYFAGDLQLVSMEGWGTDAFIFLRRLGDAAEPIREASFGGEAIVSFPGFQPERASSSSLTGSVFSPHAGASSGPAAESGSTGSGPSWPFAGGAPSGGGSGAAAFFPAAGAGASAGVGGVASASAAGLPQRPATAHASVRLKIRNIGEAAHAAVAAAQAQASLSNAGASGSGSGGAVGGAGR